jgi:hypothetical protein
MVPCFSFKRIPSYDEIFGVALFESMYAIAPDAWDLFPWTAKEMAKKGEKFLAFAKKFVHVGHGGGYAWT